MKSLSRRTVYVLLLVAVVAVIVFAILARRSACVSDERGLRGEVKRAQDGKLLYFNGKCWTREPVAPTDTPF